MESAKDTLHWKFGARATATVAVASNDGDARVWGGAACVCVCAYSWFRVFEFRRMVRVLNCMFKLFGTETIINIASAHTHTTIKWVFCYMFCH